MASYPQSYDETYLRGPLIPMHRWMGERNIGDSRGAISPFSLQEVRIGGDFCYEDTLKTRLRELLRVAEQSGRDWHIVTGHHLRRRLIPMLEEIQRYAEELERLVEHYQAAEINAAKEEDATSE